MIKPSDEGRMNTWGGLRARPRAPRLARRNVEGRFLKEMKIATPGNTPMIRKQNHEITDAEKDWVVWPEDPSTHNHPLSQSLVQNNPPDSVLWSLRGKGKAQKQSQKLAELG